MSEKDIEIKLDSITAILVGIVVFIVFIAIELAILIGVSK